MRFEGGKAVDCGAAKGLDLLKSILAVDEGATHLGEVALVPHDSPIARTGILFYSTLYDENAACHLAFGEAYSECIKGGENMSKEELKAHGLNDSITHVDFMVGTADLSITGRTRDGKEGPHFCGRQLRAVSAICQKTRPPAFSWRARFSYSPFTGTLKLFIMDA